jgi:hypothetical protein
VTTTYKDKHVFVDGRKFMETHGLWELLTKSRPDKNVVILQNRQAYKQILLRSNASLRAWSSGGGVGVAPSLGTLERMLRKAPDKEISLQTGPFTTEGNLESGGGARITGTLKDE